MINDNILRSELYYPLHKNFKAAFDFIKTAISDNYGAGKYEIDGKDLYASIQEYTSKLPEDAKTEGHKNYIDIQFIVSGTEVIDSFDITKAMAVTEYNPDKDFTQYENKVVITRSILNGGDFAIYFPHDIHRPGMCFNGSQAPVKKIVVKVKAQ